MNTELKSKMIAAERAQLRDEFAKAALQGMLADHTRDMYVHELAEKAYEFADAMLEAREG